MESTASVIVDPDRVKPIIPDDFPCRKAASISAGRTRRLSRKSSCTTTRFTWRFTTPVNKLNHIVIDSPRPRLGIMAAGKAYLDVRQALEDLGIDDELAKAIGLRVFKVGMVWPLEPEGVHEFASGLEKSLVVEEKRQVLEYQLKEQLYNWKGRCAPAGGRQVRRQGRMGAPAW